MRIQTITSRDRNDFYAIYECEHCKATRKSYGYEDSNFHENVIPSWHCTACGKNRFGDDRVYAFVRTLAQGDITSPFKVDPLERANSHIDTIIQRAKQCLDLPE